MAPKRKRGRTSKSDAEEPRIRARLRGSDQYAAEHVKHPTLSLYYEQISTLREYLLSQLPNSSKKRRRKIASLGKTLSGKEADQLKESLTIHRGPLVENSEVQVVDSEVSLAILLDQTLICSVEAELSRDRVCHAKDFEAFSQQVGLTAPSSSGQGASSQSELVDFAIWLLFHRVHRQSHRPPHMLCHGFQRARGPQHTGDDLCAVAGIPGIVSHYPNINVSILKDARWIGVLNLLGKDGEQVILNMLMHCGIFVSVQSGKGNYSQLSGTPMTDLQVPEAAKILIEAEVKGLAVGEFGKALKAITGSPEHPRTPAAIVFVRNRMFYARASLNAKGRVTFGLRHIHALNRYPDPNNIFHILRLLQYMFPRQFGLHNVFTSSVNPKETVQPFQDYTLREKEIAQKEQAVEIRAGHPSAGVVAKNIERRVPKRLRGRAVQLVRKLQKLHSRCSYNEMLKYYCPLKRPKTSSVQSYTERTRDMNTIEFVTQVSNHTQASATVSEASQVPSPEPKPTFFDLATPHANVSAFCRAALSKLVPDSFWGEGEHGQDNKKIILQNIDRFVTLRRFEPLSLHVVFQGLKLNAIAWLAPVDTDQNAKKAQSDTQKRTEIFLEFLYYVFDSILIPLIRSNFHVTESGVHQNHLFYFRHDVWRLLTEPAMTKIKLDLFEEIETPKARKLLDGRPLGFSQIRLLPKISGVRPITNLRRRVTKLHNGKIALGRSINSVMAPVQNVLDFEKRKKPSHIGSALFSVGEMYPKLKKFAGALAKSGGKDSPLFFAKADAKSCFDTIPQREVIKLIEKTVSEEGYRIARHSEIKPSKSFYYRDVENRTSNPARKFIATARDESDFDEFDQIVESSLAAGKKNTIFVDGIVQQPQKADNILDLLEEHVERNVIKIGKKFFRQKSGIPQGSVLSSLLCNYFYAELEREHFAFLEEDESIFLRLIDDFLLITTNKDHARRFLQIMHDGLQKYGVEVNPAKSLANFDVMINGHKVPQQPKGSAFPYCGNAIDPETLEITKDRDRRKDTVLANTLTVDPSKVPGKAFYRKALNAFKIQTHRMFLDTNLNSVDTVLSTIYQNFAEAAMKYYRYAKSMPTGKQPSADLSIGTIQDLIDLAFVLVKGKHTRQKNDGFDCAVSKRQICWLAGRAFRHVLGQKQTKYRVVLAWLNGLISADAGCGSGGKELGRLERIAQAGDAVFRDYRY